MKLNEEQRKALSQEQKASRYVTRWGEIPHLARPLWALRWRLKDASSTR